MVGRGHFRIKFNVDYFMSNHQEIAPNYSCLSFIKPLAERHDIPCEYLWLHTLMVDLSVVPRKLM
jgi:hypothetical protein